MTKNPQSIDPGRDVSDSEWRLELGTASRTAAAATVTVYPDGPLVLRGDFEVRDLGGSVTPTGRIVALCRCGRSALKPLCDGSHKNATSRGAPTGPTPTTRRREG